MADVVIVGSGLAGLSCARRLREWKVDCLVVEASDGVGGRVRTDRVDGFLLDRGFQVLLTAYPEAIALLDYNQLQLHSFEPGALVQRHGARHLMADPWRRPGKALESLLAPIGTLGDKLRVARMRYQVLYGGDRPETSTLAYLEEQGFSSSFINDFFRPFWSGIFLEPDLRTSSRVAEFVFRMMALGDTALPRQGMGAISQQLASDVPVRLNSTVVGLTGQSITLESGERLQASAVVLATEGPAAARLMGLPEPGSRSVSCVYFAADVAPISEGILVLNGDGCGPVNHLCVPSAVSSSYAPPGAALVSATVLGMNPDLAAVREQLAGWFGPVVHRWQHLRTYRIAHGQPELTSLQFPPGLHVCGDYLESASIQGALVSGRRAAEAVMKTL